MAKALVLISVEPGQDRAVANQVKEVKGVKKVYLVAGLFDVVAEVEAPDDAALLALVYDKIRVIADIRETQTLFCLPV